MTHQDLIRKVRGKFWQLLQSKTGWGKNEVVRVFDRACTHVLAGVVDELEAAGRQPTQAVGQWVNHSYVVTEDEKNLSIQPAEWVNPLREDRPLTTPDLYPPGEAPPRIKWKEGIIDAEYYERREEGDGHG
jgi:hypothetical protein